MRLSFARVSAYRRCPYQYRLAWIEKVPPKSRPYTRLANALHLALAAFHRGKAPTSPDAPQEPSLATLLDLYRRAWTGRLTPFDRKQLAVGESILRVYVQRLGSTMPNTIHVEAPFEIQLGPHVVYGRLDRVDETADGLDIVDYKTADTKIEPNTLQLDVYQLGLQALSGRLANRVAYYYLRSNERVEFVRGEADARRTRDLLVAAARELESDWQLSPRPGPACVTCPYTAHCPAVNARPEPLPGRRAGDQLRLELG